MDNMTTWPKTSAWPWITPGPWIDIESSYWFTNPATDPNEGAVTGSTNDLTWKPVIGLNFNEAADLSCGTFICLCFLVGIMGNIVSFIHFAKKKRDISSVIYMMITANDAAFSITVFPMGIAYFLKQPVSVFKSKNGCGAWLLLKNRAFDFTNFLTFSLCVTRTVSLVDPFRRQKIRYLLLVALLYASVSIAKEFWIIFAIKAEALFDPSIRQCGWTITGVDNIMRIDALNTLTIISSIIFQLSPAIAVAVSCAISAALLTKTNNNVQQQELQRSRKRATVTILLFALLYEVCYLPYVVDTSLRVYSWATFNWEWYSAISMFDKQFYFLNARSLLLPAANSAANPVLYFWRMPALREFARTGVRRMFGVSREIRRPEPRYDGNKEDAGASSRIVQNCQVAVRLPISGNMETGL